MNNFEKKLKDFYGGNDFEKIQNTYIGIAGAGGLGSNCANFLVRSGFKNFVIVDFDKVEYLNMNRQFFFYNQNDELKTDALKKNLESINPNLNIKIINKKIDGDEMLEIFSECNVIVEAFDNPTTKALITKYYLNSDKLFIACSGICGVGNSDDIKIQQLNNNSYLVGDMKSDFETNKPFAPKVNIAAAKQADIILEKTLEK